MRIAEFEQLPYHSKAAAFAMATRESVLAFSDQELYKWLLIKLKEEVGEDSIEEMRIQRINGRSFLELNEDDLREMVPLLGERKAIVRLINNYKRPPQAQVSILHLFKKYYVGAHENPLAFFFNTVLNTYSCCWCGVASDTTYLP